METAKAITVQELQEMCKQAIELDEQITALEAEMITPRKKKLSDLEGKIQACMEQLDMEKIPVKGYGTYFLQSKFSVKVPKTEQEREDFFAYLQAKGIFESMITVNSQTLNAWYKQEMEALASRAEAGEDVDPDFKIPGIEEPKDYFTLAFRKETKRGGKGKISI